MAGTLSSRLREARGLTTGESTKQSSGPPAPACGSRAVADVRSEVGSQSPRERRLFGPGTGRRSPMVTLKVPKIEDLKHNHLNSRSSKAKAQETLTSAQANPSSGDAPGAKIGFGAKESPKKPLAQGIVGCRARSWGWPSAKGGSSGAGGGGSSTSKQRPS